MEEIWKDIEGYEGLYQVSNLGRVKSISRYVNGFHGFKLKKGKILRQSISSVGYYVVSLSKNNRKRSTYIHRLVAEAFIPNVDNKPEVNHIDGNKQNNNADNLEWATCRENIIHAWKNGLSKISNKVIENGKNNGRKLGKMGTIKVNQYDINGKFLKTWDSIIEASKHYNIDRGNITKCCKGKYNNCGGFIWKYK